MPGPIGPGPGHQAAMNAHRQAADAHQRMVEGNNRRNFYYSTSHQGSGGCAQVIGFIISVALVVVAYSYFTNTPLDTVLNSIVTWFNSMISNFQ